MLIEEYKLGHDPALWPVSGTGLSVPSFYDPRNLAITAIVMAAVVTFLRGPKTLATYWHGRGQAMATAALGSRQP